MTSALNVASASDAMCAEIGLWPAFGQTDWTGIVLEATRNRGASAELGWGSVCG